MNFRAIRPPHVGGILLSIVLSAALAAPVVDFEKIPYPSEKLAPALSPIWRGGRINEEPVLFVRDPATQIARASLLFVPNAIVAVREPGSAVSYEEGRDFVWKPDSREILLPAGSRIRSVLPTELRRPKKSQKYSLPHRDGGDDIFFASLDEYQKLQTWITYDCVPGQWSGPVPAFAGAHLPRTLAKLRAAGELRITLLGDSISGGCNASGWANVAPFQPPYFELFRRQLAATYGSRVTLTNLSLGGSDSAWATKQTDAVLETQPDLLIVAFGGNDAHRRPAAEYRENISTVIARIRAKKPDCEFIVVSTMPGNRDWVALKQELYPQYRDALASLTGPGVAFADVTSFWEELLRFKTHYDLTGNGVNHPNDFGHRVYAQIFLALLHPAAGGREIVEIRNKRQLLLDRSLLAKTENVRLTPHAPVPAGIALRTDKPWESKVLYMSSVVYLDGYYRMLYRAAQDKLCLALSRDGITWEKPSLGLVAHNGSTDNNIIADDRGHPIGMGLSFLDPRPDTPRDERIKILIWSDGERYYHYPLHNPAGAPPTSTTWRPGVRLVILGSADGHRFRELPLQSDLRSPLPNAFDGGSLFWSEEEQQFVGYFRFWDENPATHARLLEDRGVITGRGVRSVFRTTSKDLRHWTPGQPMRFGDTPREHFYESGTFPYFRAPHLYVALANRFNPGRRALTEDEEAALNLPRSVDASGRRLSFADDSNDLVLLVAKPGRAEYDRPFLEAFMRPGLNPGNWASRSNYTPQHGGVIPTGEGEMSFFVTRQHFQVANHIERLVLRTDGFASLRAPYEGGEFTTVPFVCPGGRLEVNFSTSAAGEVRIEVQSDEGRPLPGFHLEDCPPHIGDRIAGTVRWTDATTLDAVRDKPIRLRFRFSDADIFAFRFTSAGN